MILGNNIFLVPITIEDTDLVVKWRNNPKVQSNFIFREQFTNDMHENWIKNMVEKNKVCQFIIVECLSKKKIGSVYLRDINMLHKNAEFGIFIGEDKFRGIGYGTEATKLIIEYAFRNLNLHRVFLRVFEENQQAINSYKKSGFNIEGVAIDMVFMDGKFHNIVFMSKINTNDNNHN